MKSSAGSKAYENETARESCGITTVCDLYGWKIADWRDEESYGDIGKLMRKRLWVLTELYYPEETSTGYFVTKIAEGLAEKHSVGVLCVQPTYSSRGICAPSHELHNGVLIDRCKATAFDKDSIIGRIVNSLTISISLFSNLLFRLKSEDLVLVVTNPPTLPFLASLACCLRGSRCMLLIHDVYPEVLIVTGMIEPGGLLHNAIRWLTQLMYRQNDRIIVLGRDMKNLIAGKVPGYSAEKIVIIPNWADLDEITPASRPSNCLLSKMGLTHKFVVQYSGNIGRTHGLETVLEAAMQLIPVEMIHFIFCGAGAKKEWVESEVQKNNMNNITIIESQPRSELGNLLNACDVAIISFMPGMAGVSVPSRMYNILAAGKPIIAVADPDSELALVILEEEIGWVVPPARPDKLVEAVLQAQSDREVLLEMGTRARRAAVEKYPLSRSIDSYNLLIEGL